jgi:hypothetical protein
MASDELGSDPRHAAPAQRSAEGARRALRELDEVRSRFGHQLAAPWWYKALAALTVGLLFVGAGMPYETVSVGSSSTGAGLVVVAAVLGPLGLRELLKRSTGASFDRYHDGWARPSMVLIALLVACVCLQSFADLDLAPLVGAGVGAAFTFACEERTDRRLARGHFPAGERARG